MNKSIWMAVFVLFFTTGVSTTGAANPWGKNYFPNVPLTTQDGETVRFFDDMIKDKIVAINFIYTSCPDSCPLETAKLVRVQDILGDRLGKDVFFYSISIDPENDTPHVLKEYRKKFGARWTFLTGKKSDITKLRRKLGLYIEEIQKEGSNNHNVSMIIGNQKTGRWMKRQPFENPHVLADQLGNWLTGWKSAPKGDSYANAPKLRSIPRGEQIFRTRCSTCHTVTGNELAGALGPDLLGVTRRRDKQWLLNWLKAPDQMLKKKDAIAIELYEKYNKLAMPNMRLNKDEAMVLLDYFEDETKRLQDQSNQQAQHQQHDHAMHMQHQQHDHAMHAQYQHDKHGAKAMPVALGQDTARQDITGKDTAGLAKKSPGDVVAIMNAWVRQAYRGAKVNAGYMTLVNVGSKEVKLEKIESDAFKKIEIHEMAMVNGLMEMHEVNELPVPAKSQVSFQPGGMHLMLMGPQKHFTAGQKIDMTLTFKSGQQQTLTVSVVDR